jgi:ribonuclease R
LLPGDTVEYETTSKNTINITKIKDRKRQILLGIIKNITQEKHVELFFPGFPKKFTQTIHFVNDYTIGQVVILQIDKNKCDVLHTYSSIQDRSQDKDIILQLYKLNSNLSNIYPKYKYKDNTNHKLPELTSFINENEHQDLTHLDTFNVDPVNSKDFDDAISIDSVNNKIYVHIVDAHEQIIPSTTTDLNALTSTFTLYLPEHIENILPKEYAEYKLSLVKNEKRKTITVEFIIDPDTQQIINYSIYKSTIIIKNRYNYQEFNNIIHNYPTLILFYEKWKKQSLNIPHIKMNINPNTGHIINYWFESNNDLAHKVIETFMILTNITVSKHIPDVIPQRYHCKNKSDFVVETYFNNEIIDAIFSIKQYRPAVYDATKEGHFGLGVKTYTHFTSPIRRYFDIIIHRLLSGVEYENLEEVLQHINQREIYIEKIVKLYENLKILSLFETQLKKIWKGYVINKTKNGYVVLLEDLLYEVFIFDNKYNVDVKDIVNVKITGIKWVYLEVKAVIVVN